MGMQPGTQVWIPCRRTEGMFSNESAVEIVLESGETLSLYVDNGLVEGTGDRAKLRVYVADGAGATVTVLLPTDSIQGSRWARLPEADLVAA